MKQRLALILVLLTLAAAAFAQKEFLTRPSPFAGRTLLTLSLFDEVRTEIKSTADQSSKIDGLTDKLMQEMMDAFQNANGDISAIQEAQRTINAKYDDELAKVLSADQMSRLTQLFIQYNGAAAALSPKIGKDLGITDDQKAKFKQAQSDQSQKIMDAFQNGGGSQEEAMAAIKKVLDDFTAAIDKILTDDQRAKLKTMQGAKFEFKKS